jgi:DNA-binding PadR family transcriptional regulator
MPHLSAPAGPARAATAAALAAALLLAACGERIEADIRKRFAERHDKPLCIQFRTAFPAAISVNPINQETLIWLSALEAAGLVAGRELPPDRRSFFADRRVEFSLTDAGRRQLQPEKGFCYGRAEIVEVIDYTQPSQVSGVATVQAQARLRRHIDAAWARDPALAELVKAGDQTVDMVLVKKAKGGWSPAY